MKQRILGNVLAEQQPASAVRKTEWQKPLLAAALLVSLLGNAYWLMKGNDTPQQVVVDQLDRTVSLQPADSTHAEATAMLLKKKDKTEVLVQASGLQALQSKQVYQVWLLKGGKPYRAGTFVPNEKGDGAVAYSVPEEKWDTIAITIEPDAENEAPEGPIIFSHAL
nr:anti-sigma factor [Ectobacillus ponti]